MRALAFWLALAAVVFLVTGGRIVFLPLLLPLGLLALARRRMAPAIPRLRRRI